MLTTVRARSVVLLSGAIVVALALAATAMAAHSMTSPTDTGLYRAKNHSGFVAFTWTEIEKKNHTDVMTITKFRFHDGCTNAVTRIKPKMHVRHNKFSYGADDVKVAGKLIFHPRSNFPVIKGTVTLTDPDCAADPNGVITFKANS
jgi:hypothetical protein